MLKGSNTILGTVVFSETDGSWKRRNFYALVRIIYSNSAYRKLIS